MVYIIIILVDAETFCKAKAAIFFVLPTLEARTLEKYYYLLILRQEIRIKVHTFL